MTTANGAMNARAARKSLGEQIDRLDGILDGLAVALNESVADAVWGAISHAVGEAVHAAVKEVLSSPDLLRAALARHEPAVAPTAATAADPEVTPRRTPKGILRRARAWAGSKLAKAAAGATRSLSGAWARSLLALRNGYARLRRVAGSAVHLITALPGTAAAIFVGLCRSPKSVAIAAAVGVACAVAVYHAGPAIAGAVGGLAGTALTAAGMVLVPLCRALSGGEGRDA
jgi:hypothetical protein